MCGIVGVRRFDGRPVSEELLRAMTAQLTHRGPDGEGYWVDGPVGFGHRRLSIIDVAGSPQPMATSDEQVHVTFNGEIFNFRELREGCDYPFRTSGDTEVLLALYRREGFRSVERLRGQFAYAIHDGEDLWLFRDRLGVLPLFTYQDADMFAFASEIKALLPALPTSPPTCHGGRWRPRTRCSRTSASSYRVIGSGWVPMGSPSPSPTGRSPPGPLARCPTTKRSDWSPPASRTPCAARWSPTCRWGPC